MLVIRKAQMDALRRARRSEFERQMEIHLRAMFAENLSVVSPAVLSEKVRIGVDKASSYGVTTRYDVRMFLEHMVRLGWDFDSAIETSWAGEILRRPKLSGARKMDLILLEYALVSTRS